MSKFSLCAHILATAGVTWLAACGDDQGGRSPDAAPPDTMPAPIDADPGMDAVAPDATPAPDAAPGPTPDAAPGLDAGIDVPPRSTFLGTGNHFSVVRDGATGRVHAMGENPRAQLGIGLIDPAVAPSFPYPAPQLVEGLDAVEVQAVFTGQEHSAVLDTAGRLYLWGLNNTGALGLGAAVDDPTVTAPGCSVVPAGPFYDDKPNNHVCTAAPGPTLTGVVDVAAGNGFTLAITSSGALYAWGNNPNGQLGIDPAITRAHVPVPVTALADEVIVDIAVGISHSLAVTREGVVYAWGRNSDGQLGQGTTDTNEIPTPVAVPALLGKRVVAVGTGNFHSFAITDAGELYAWGENEFGQLGTGAITENEPTPTAVALPAGVAPMAAPGAVIGGSRHSYLLSADGDVYSWGRVGDGQLGNGQVETGSPLFVLAPEKIQALDEPVIVELVAGPNHALVRTATGTILGWGSNGQGRLGQGTSFAITTIYATPVPVDLGRAVETIPAHPATSLAFTDTDPSAGQVSGDLVIGKAVNEDAIDSYVLSWGSSPTTRLEGAALVARRPKTGVELVHTLPAGTVVPAGATHLLVHTANRFGEMATGVSIPLDDAGAAGAARARSTHPQGR